ncbi:lysine N(6)-hydroxylase/L-ornithine N(5)-oxygenase family protein [Solirubrobacter soli]|uniref:lysine N(6)-hydroxylase/L-ornithine N(5)-oxygenase family protein n=1 Tax=Solirubrobacter soli TaxID=363832 RepID=UPI0004223548|nr:SidA/IucD/PvdA family monooxygenase [Solirubrobacter soli]
MHDVIGVGLGPFNLGLAALLAPTGVDAVFFDDKPEFAWHPGLMLPGAEIQVPFLADLVTLADPTSPYTFLNYLHAQGRLFRFYFHERFHVLRAEYEDYCRWVASSLESCRFSHRVDAIRPVEGGWAVWARGVEHRARHVVLGVGCVPWVPECARALTHSSAYLGQRDAALSAGSVTVIGSGQSAAEIFADLLEHASGRVDWFTRSSGFLPMEYSKLGLEHFSPEYTAYFHALPEARRDALRGTQALLYKGIDAGTSERIYDLLYRRSVGGSEPAVRYTARCELRGVEGRHRLHLRQLDQDVAFTHDTDVVILATGYQPAPLPLPAGLVSADAAGRPVVELDYRLRLTDGAPSTLFVQNAELHTHGVGTPDLGLGAHRSAVIANAVCGREVYPVRERNVFQSFGAPVPPAESAAA